ncbi:hypothetical protein JCGZ_00249 [Jatropha curcas]|uniref:Uncharacterized protein n=1 Tax=Jatropha curcas TaxID=180498 RepID=A0A067L1Z2_JATCU|nr:uncharacterized protein LOC105629671 [Jatropha curcas]KDP42452.1 hypothetical protein JCGZ_00249 [Jatropha curcas]
MKGYSKIKIISSVQPRSMDISDPLFLEPTKANNYTDNTHFKKTQETNFSNLVNISPKPLTNKIKNQESPLSWIQEDQASNNNGEIFNSYKLKRNTSVSSGEIFNIQKLKRNSSVSSASTAIHSAVKKAFSMKRSSSVSERYCRIHDQSLAIPSTTCGGGDDDDDSLDTTRSMKRKNSKRILRACKKLLGL